MKNEFLETNTALPIDKSGQSGSFELQKKSSHPLMKWVKSKKAQKKGIIIHEVLKQKLDLF